MYKEINNQYFTISFLKTYYPKSYKTCQQLDKAIAP